MERLEPSNERSSRSHPSDLFLIKKFHELQMLCSGDYEQYIKVDMMIKDDLIMSEVQNDSGSEEIHDHNRNSGSGNSRWTPELDRLLGEALSEYESAEHTEETKKKRAHRNDFIVQYLESHGLVITKRQLSARLRTINTKSSASPGKFARKRPTKKSPPVKRSSSSHVFEQTQVVTAINTEELEAHSSSTESDLEFLKNCQQYILLNYGKFSTPDAVPPFKAKCAVTSVPHSTGKLGYLSLPFNEHDGKWSCGLLSVYHLAQPCFVEIITTVVNFGMPILKYCQRYQTLNDPGTGYDLVIVDNKPVNDFLETLCKDQTNTTKILKSMFISQSVMHVTTPAPITATAATTSLSPASTKLESVAPKELIKPLLEVFVSIEPPCQ